MASSSPKSLSLRLSGVSPSSSAAAWMSAWMLPTSVCMPMAVTTAVQVPLAIAVLEKSMLSLAWISQSLRGTGSTNLFTGIDSPAILLVS